MAFNWNLRRDEEEGGGGEGEGRVVGGVIEKNPFLWERYMYGARLICTQCMTCATPKFEV